MHIVRSSYLNEITEKRAWYAAHVKKRSTITGGEDETVEDQAVGRKYLSLA
jgi:hypothetical protein